MLCLYDIYAITLEGASKILDPANKSKKKLKRPSGITVLDPYKSSATAVLDMHCILSEDPWIL